MSERGIQRDEVEQVVLSGEVIEQYDDDASYPSKLLMGNVQGRPLHVVAAWNSDNAEWIVITAYEPEPQKWYDDFKRRRR